MRGPHDAEMGGLTMPMCAETMNSGAVDFLTNPVDDKELLAAVGRALAFLRSAHVRPYRR